uniref:Uncharacterized protein n=1 Tax=Cannabis sativa TaxID=3483 RepID=A0A803QD10_CANSA
MFSLVRFSTTGGPIHKLVTQMAKDATLKKARSAVLGLTIRQQKILISGEKTRSSELSMGKTIEVEANSGSKVKTKNSKA